MKKKLRKINPIILLAAAAVLLLASTAGSTQAALTYYSKNYSAEVKVSNIGITLLENDKEISCRNYLEDDQWEETKGTLFTEMIPEGEELILGKDYKEELAVKNSGAIDSYVRVILTKSWKDAQGVKNTKLSPALIDLNLLTGDNDWVVDQQASTPERTVLYYTKILPVGETTPDFSDWVSIDPSVATKVKETVETVGTVSGNDMKTVTYTFVYDGYTFSVEVEADAVQTHNAEDAIKSAWGVDVNVTEDGSLSLQ